MTRDPHPKLMASKEVPTRHGSGVSTNFDTPPREDAPEVLIRKESKPMVKLLKKNILKVLPRNGVH